MTRATRFSPEVRERAVRMVFEHAEKHASQWAAICSIAEKIGCTAETLRHWVRQAERDAGQRAGLLDVHLTFLSGEGDVNGEGSSYGRVFAARCRSYACDRRHGHTL